MMAVSVWLRSLAVAVGAAPEPRAVPRGFGRSPLYRGRIAGEPLPGLAHTVSARARDGSARARLPCLRSGRPRKVGFRGHDRSDGIPGADRARFP